MKKQFGLNQGSKLKHKLPVLHRAQSSNLYIDHQHQFHIDSSTSSTTSTQRLPNIGQPFDSILNRLQDLKMKR